MRRALFLLLAVTPAFALGQSITAAPSTTINLAQCNGAQPTPDDLQLSDEMNVKLSWTVKQNLPSDVTSIPTDGTAHYTLYASTKVIKAGEDDKATTQPCDANNDASTPLPQRVNVQGQSNTFDIAVTSSIGGGGTITDQTYALKDIVGKVGLSACTAGQQTPVYLCAQLFIKGTAAGFAKVTMNLDTTKPTAVPTNVRATPGDGKLRLACDGGAGISTFKATASVAGNIVARSDESSSCSDLTIDGLTNKTQYSIVVYGISSVHNPGAGSTALAGASTTPIPTHDYWDQCQHDGCPEQGGCATGGLAAGIAGAFSILVALRRRKS